VLKPIAQALAGWAPQGEGSEPDPLGAIGAGWPIIAGADIAKHSRPFQLAGDTLTVVTRSSAWNEQLSFLAERILASLHEHFGFHTITRLRFRTGRISRGEQTRTTRAKAGTIPTATVARQDSVSAQEAVARFRRDVAHARRAKSSAGWKECKGCATMIAPAGEAFCKACSIARTQERERLVARLLFEVPWLGFAGIAGLVDELTLAEYTAIRARLLARWWETLLRARASKHLSESGRERLIASSYVVVKSGLEPEHIAPATVRNLLGDELCELIYGIKEQN
jgi:hypothetical protein